MKHKVSVTMPVEISFTIDDTKVSDWDGRDLMHVHENPERWAVGRAVLRDTAIAAMAAQIIDRGRLAGTDGWADFADEATTEISWPNFRTGDAEVHVRTES